MNKEIHSQVEVQITIRNYFITINIYYMSEYKNVK